MTAASSPSSPTSTPPPAAAPPDLPDRLIKHEVRYSHHQELDWDLLTPMMRHYVEVKAQHQSALLLYRMGDFFECFFEDAITVARELELVLTSKDAGKAVGRVPMAGIPHHALDRYCAQLVEKGYAIAICDQIEAAAQAQGPLVRREVTRIITPGTILEEGMLPARRNNYLVAIASAGAHWGLAYTDISTGEFLATQASDIEQLAQELLRLQPSEVLLPTQHPDLVGLLRPEQKKQHLPPDLPTAFCYTLRSPRPFELAEARQRLLERFRIKSLEGLGCEQLPLAVRAAGGLLEYLEDTSEGRSRHYDSTNSTAVPKHATLQHIPLQMLSTYSLSEYLILDHQTRRNLEILQTVRDGSFHGSLLWALDQTVTPMGGRALRRWFLQPLLDLEAIAQRQATVQEFVADGYLRDDLRKHLNAIYDLERLAGRAGSGTANARDLLALADSIVKLPVIAARVASAQSPYLKALQTVPIVLEELARKLHNAIVESPPLHLTEGGIIRPGVDSLLDQMRQSIVDDQQWIANLESIERERTGISTLKVSYNKTFGYYIGISRAKADQVPDAYIRKQTLTNEERFITSELKDR
ncbi:MAG: DNA mismatch repair protein MutS, partial [Cyanobacteria bacterium P01_H01_bin.121]